MPEITGDTANGRSISVVSRFLPGKSNFAIAQPAQTPNTQIGRHGDRRGQQRQPQRGQRVRLANRVDDTRPTPLAKRLDEHRDERQHQEQRQEQQGDGRQQPRGPSGGSVRCRRRSGCACRACA